MKKFIVAELVLILAVPFLGIAGYHALLDSQDGRFVEPLTESDPGWRALVEPTDVTALVETDQGVITGLTLVVGSAELGGGSLILVPGTLMVEGEPLAAREPVDAVAVLSEAMKLRIAETDVLTAERWVEILPDARYKLDNPDPVEGLPVGSVEIGSENVAMFLGRPADGFDPITVHYRRVAFWEAVAEAPPEVLHGASEVVELPLKALEPNPEMDAQAVEEMIRELVPVPAGALPGDRVEARILDRTGLVDLEAVALEVASTGLEVVEIGNAEIDGGESYVLVPPGVDGKFVSELGIDGAIVLEDESATVVTLMVGSDYLAAKGVDSERQRVGSIGRGGR